MTHTIAREVDSFALLASLPEGCVDLVLTDPPFEAHVQNNQISGTAVRDHVNGKTKGIPKIQLPFAPIESYAFVSDLVRVSRRWALCWTAVEGFGEMRRAAPEAWIRGGIWYKPNAQGQMTGDRPAACYEGIGILHRPGKKSWNGRGSYGLWPCNGTRGKKDRHPNEKPIDLCLKLVALFSNRGESVFDPFCGSGAIGEAAHLLGRRYIGCDQDQGWVDRARNRIANAAPFGSVSDEEALAKCKARKVDILEPEEVAW